MKRARTGIAVLGALVAVVSWGAAPVGAAEQTLKQLMGENFAGLQTILIALITANYSSVPAQVKRIEDHAQELTHRVPSDITGARRDRFMSYAYNLRAHASDLNSVVQALIEHDKGKTQIAADELREAAAAHYGGMVSMCVACHNRFRPRVVH